MQNAFLTGLFITLLSIFVEEKKDVAGAFTGKPVLELTSLDSSKWYLARIHSDSSVTEVARKKAFIRFNEAKGSAGGNGSCNSFGSNMKRDGNTISFTNVFSTKMYCDDVQAIEDSFFSRLQKVTRYEMKGTTLFLLEGDKVVLEFEK